jgi:hypothetical protein
MGVERSSMTRIELATPLGIGAILGVSAGIIIGIMAGPVGALVGICAGAIAGAFTGTAMLRDEGHRAARSRHLDEIIGVSGGDLGAAPVSIPPPDDAEISEIDARDRWLAEWLTPPPPAVG